METSGTTKEPSRVIGHVRREGFEKTVVFLSVITAQLEKALLKGKSFRLELEYDAEALNTEYKISYTSESNGTSLEFPEA